MSGAKTAVGWGEKGAFLVALLLTGCMAAGRSSPGTAGLLQGAAQPEQAPQLTFAPLAERVSPAVVNITTAVASPSPFPGVPHSIRGLGSGFIIDEQGTILTNNHVVANATEIRVRLVDGRELNASVIGRDPDVDLALIRVTGRSEPLPVAKLGDSDAARQGDVAMAVGNPFGLAHTVTVGVISAKQRVIGAGPFDDFLQTDAAINPGNSGGPLFNLRGEVIGINSAIVEAGEGLGFAVPINIAKRDLPQLEQKGTVTRGWLGVELRDLTPELARLVGVPYEKGALVVAVEEGSPAEKAGMQPGDVVIGANGKRTESAHELSLLAASSSPGDRLEMDLLRRQKREHLAVTLGQRPGRR